MEDWQVFVFTVVVIALICDAIYLAHLINCKEKERIYVYPKTKNQYYAKGVVKMKDTDSGEWIDAVLYISLKNGNYYVRDKRQFLGKFVTLKEWKKNGGNGEGSRRT